MSSKSSTVPHMANKAFSLLLKEIARFSMQSLDEHQLSLRQSIIKTTKYREGILERSALEPNNLALTKLAQQLNKHISTLERAARDLAVPQTKATIFETLKAEMHKINERIHAFYGSNEAEIVANLSTRIKRTYFGSRKTTIQRFVFCDAVYEAGLEYAIDKSSADERAYQLALMPRSILHQKWYLMIYITAHKCGLKIDHSEALLLARLYTRLSDHERGADNITLAQTHKFRHNPAIHSLHTCILADKILENALPALRKSNNLESEVSRTEFNKIRQLLMTMAIVHDLGESEGELSSGSDMMNLQDDDKIRFLVDRENLETEVFKRNLAARSNIIYMDDASGGQKKEKVTAKLLRAFELAEDTDSFVGRLFKTLERMQTQHDYLRFQKLNGATPLEESGAPNIAYASDYVSSIFRDAPRNKPEGEKSLRNLAENEKNPTLKAIYQAIYQAISIEYAHLQGKIEKSYGKAHR